MSSSHAPDEVAAPRTRLGPRIDQTDHTGAGSGVLPDHGVRPRAASPSPAHRSARRGHRMGGIGEGAGVVRMGNGWQSTLAPVRCAVEGISK
ncbi:hypothetical protein [Streptomyces achromogenes]|uniref:hypothetical protein n=1 Tax=Streptomyces achromogenes TaxID=67255 RepID=UPI0036F7CD74